MGGRAGRRSKKDKRRKRTEEVGQDEGRGNLRKERGEQDDKNEQKRDLRDPIHGAHVLSHIHLQNHCSISDRKSPINSI